METGPGQVRSDVGQRRRRIQGRRALERPRRSGGVLLDDPATAILEVAVHKGFKALDMVPHVLSGVTITDPAGVHVVDPASIPNWLRPGIPGAGQQAFGNDLLARHKFVLIPSVVSTHS
jgi:RES domain-containing protein